jgi:hypothetical protein
LPRVLKPGLASGKPRCTGVVSRSPYMGIVLGMVTAIPVVRCLRASSASITRNGAEAGRPECLTFWHVYGTRKNRACKCRAMSGMDWWTAWDSNPRPRRCERRALPTELAAHFEGCFYFTLTGMGRSQKTMTYPTTRLVLCRPRNRSSFPRRSDRPIALPWKGRG